MQGFRGKEWFNCPLSTIITVIAGYVEIRKLDEQLFEGAAAKIHAFLDIELLMPPGRLRLSKALNRPLMWPLT